MRGCEGKISKKWLLLVLVGSFFHELQEVIGKGVGGVKVLGKLAAAIDELAVLHPDSGSFENSHGLLVLETVQLGFMIEMITGSRESA